MQYLNEAFFSQQQLLDASSVDLSELEGMQKNGLMPLPSYILKINLACDSFFGPHEEYANLRYYAKGYQSWINTIRQFNLSEDAFLHFSDRYKTQLQRIRNNGLKTNDYKLNAGLDVHIESEWSHFLDGIYGLCTKSGLPEDIASKELAMAIVNEIVENRSGRSLTHTERVRLISAVNLLDISSSMFAPHELLRSSRHRLIDQVRKKYNL